MNRLAANAEANSSAEAAARPHVPRHPADATKLADYSRRVPVRIETDRLVIRTIEPRDAEPWLAMVTDPRVRRYLPPFPPPTADVVDGMIERRQAMEQERGYAMWAVESKESGTLVGQCGMYPAEHRGPEVELAYHFEPAAWNRGYATEAARGVLEYAFAALGMKRVIAFVMPANVASCRVVEKAGMRFEATVTAYGIEGLRKYVAEAE
jgi:RimJ/RimL family protein N-acetyltransferase